MADFSLSGETAIGTGAAGGIGSETVRQYAAVGVRVVPAGRNTEDLPRLQLEILATGASAIARPIDVCAPDAVQSLVDRGSSSSAASTF